MPARKGSSLAEQLAAISNPAPTDFDPENEDHFQASETDASDAESEQDDGRNHYEVVGKSRLRDTGSEQALPAEYKGQKTSREALFGAPPDSEAESFDDSDEHDGDLPSEEESFQTSDSEGDESSSSNDVPDEEAAKLRQMLADDQAAMVQAVVKTSTDDAEKGLAVKQQLSMYDSLLDARIKLQKGLQAVNEPGFMLNGTADDIAVSTAEQSALTLIENLFSFREEMLKQDIPALTINRKRRYDDQEPVTLDDLWGDMNEMSDGIAGWRDSTLTKWSNKIRSAASVDRSKKFKALDQSITAQINEYKSDRAKLVQRTQIRRHRGGPQKGASTEEHSEDIFDDGDYYQQMLKDLIDSRMLDSSSSNQLKWLATKQPKQKKENVDTRASKGRKLRYHVHEKIQNFMAPAPTGTWHEEQIDELFGSLLGQKLAVDEDVAVEDDFRLF